MFMIYGKDNKVVLPLQEDRWYRVELLQEPSKKNGKVNSFFFQDQALCQELLALTILKPLKVLARTCPETRFPISPKVTGADPNSS